MLVVAPWQAWNEAVFMLIRATPSSPRLLIDLAISMADGALLAAVAIVAWQLWRRRDASGACRLVCAWLLTRGIEMIVSAVAFQARPFAVGFGPALIEHSANNAMPSSHAAVGFLLLLCLLHARCWGSAAVVALLAAATAWSRIYLGVHWPADMIGALLSAAVSMAAAAVLFQSTRRTWLRLRVRWVAIRAQTMPGESAAKGELAGESAGG